MNRFRRYVRRISQDKTYGFRCASSRFTNADERRRFREVWLTHLSTPALYRVSVRNLAALTRMRLTTILCQLTDTFAGFLPTVRYLPAVALVSYLIDRSHSWYPAYLKIFVLVQGTYTPQVIRHDWRTKRSSPARRTDGSSAEPDDDHALGRQTLTRWVQFPRRGGSVLQADLQSPKDCRSCNFPKSIARECEPQTCSNAKTENSNGEHASQRCSQTKLPY